jgi:hypothetical protein
MKGRLFCAVLLAAAVPIDAQVSRSRFSTDPKYWVGLSYGYVDGITLNDEESSSRWQFAYTTQLRATIEKTMQRSVTIGASAGFANGRLTYSGSALNTACGVSCRASADITQYMAFVRGGGGLGFHGTYSLEAGVTRFSNFRERESGNALPPASAASDFTFGFGGGFEYGFSSTATAYVGQQFDFVLHPQETGSAPRLLTFRAGFRVGF